MFFFLGSIIIMKLSYVKKIKIIGKNFIRRIHVLIKQKKKKIRVLFICTNDIDLRYL